MYDAAKSCIKVGNNLSEVFHCIIGVRQVKIYYLFFSMLINEFKNNLSTQYNGIHLNQLYNTDIDLELNLFTLLYADDTIVLAGTEKELHSAVDAVHEYCNKMHLTVNRQKFDSHDIFSWKSKKLSELYVWMLNIRRYL